jgi:hypothetical protein
MAKERNETDVRAAGWLRTEGSGARWYGTGENRQREDEKIKIRSKYRCIEHRAKSQDGSSHWNLYSGLGLSV